MSPGAVAREGAEAREPHAGALRDAVELVRQQRRVRRDDDDDGAVVTLGRGLATAARLAQVLADRDARDAQRRARSVVRLHQHPDRLRPSLHVHLARGRADAALESVAGHSGAAADVALFDRARFRALDRRIHVRGLHVETVDVVQLAVPGLGDDRGRPPVARGVRVAVLHAPGDRRLVHGADAVRVGEHHRPLEQAALLDPGAAGHLARAVQHEAAGERGRRDRVAPARQDRGHAGAHLAPVREILDQRALADRHAGDVGDGIERPGRAVEGDAEVACARPCLGDRRGERKGKRQDATKCAESGGQMLQPRRILARHRNLGPTCYQHLSWRISGGLRNENNENDSHGVHCNACAHVCVNHRAGGRRDRRRARRADARRRKRRVPRGPRHPHRGRARRVDHSVDRGHRAPAAG